MVHLLPLLYGYLKAVHDLNFASILRSQESAKHWRSLGHGLDIIKATR